MACLRIRSGEGKGLVVDLVQDVTTIGRGPGNGVTINDAAVSARHCCVRRDGQRYTLLDLNSTNGTVLNDVEVTESRLKPGDIIAVGSTEFVFEGEDVDSGEPAQGPAGVNSDEVPGLPYPSPTPATATFRVRESRRGQWVVVIVILLVLAITAGCWFVLRLFTD